MQAFLVLSFAVILVISNVIGMSLLSAFLARKTQQHGLIALIVLVTLGVLYCLKFLVTPLEGKLQVIFLERLPYEVGMLLGLGLLWIQWFCQVVFYWRRRRHSPIMYLIFNTLTLGQLINLVSIGIIFLLCPTIMVTQGSTAGSFHYVWLFELRWLTLFSLAFITLPLLLSLKGGVTSWQLRHWVTGTGCLLMGLWWGYWILFADQVHAIGWV